ncbi:MAG: GNAT family N-acetyltransferase [Erysipelotrichaceae bacterium]|nr:GNAT family N-acetyltransferase [Erysipelotrichaceae bacterium]
MALADYIENKPVIETERLIIREMVPDDVPNLRQWMGDEQIYEYWGKGPSKAEKDPELLFEKPKRLTKSFHLGIAEKKTNRVIGDIWVYLIENDRMASVALRLARSAQGKGYGTESLSAMTGFCFEKTELQRLWAEVDVRNTASWRMLEKCGYQREGMIRQGKMVNTWCDYYIYGILADDVREG